MGGVVHAAGQDAAGAVTAGVARATGADAQPTSPRVATMETANTERARVTITREYPKSGPSGRRVGGLLHFDPLGAFGA